MSDAESAPEENPEAKAEDEKDLNKAIEELRDVLHEGEEGDGQGAQGGSGKVNGAVVMGIPVDVQIVLGSAEMPVSDLMELQKGSTVALNRRIGEPVEVMVNGRRIARGEIIVMDNDPSRFGIRLTEVAGGLKRSA